MTNTSSRLFLGEGYYESRGQSHAFMIQTGISATAATVKYQYTFQWGTTLTTANGPNTIGTRTGTPQTPGGATSDLHRGKRA